MTTNDGGDNDIWGPSIVPDLSQVEIEDLNALGAACFDSVKCTWYRRVYIFMYHHFMFIKNGFKHDY